MPKLRLIKISPVPPGAFDYEQNEGIYRRFETTSEFSNLAFAVRDFRRGNNLPRQSEDEVWEDIGCYICANLAAKFGKKFALRFCSDGEAKPYSEISPKPPKSSCGGCGVKL